MTTEQIDQLARGIVFAGLTQDQRKALDKIVGALKETQERAKPFAVLVERYEAYCRNRADVPIRSRMDFTAWLDQCGEDPDILLKQFRALNEGEPTE